MSEAYSTLDPSPRKPAAPVPAEPPAALRDKPTQRAVEDAKKSDNAARSWLSKHLVGDEPLALAGLLQESKS
jgi:hypothetical protein